MKKWRNEMKRKAERVGGTCLCHFAFALVSRQMPKTYPS